MESGEATWPLRDPKARIFWLVFAHVTVGWVLGNAAHQRAPNYPDLWIALYLGLVFSQIGLIGIWGALGNSALPVRLLGAVCGLGYIVVQFAISAGYMNVKTLFAFSMTAAMVAMMLLVFRCRRVRIQRDTSTDETSKPQYSIRQLLILTFVVACLLPIGKWLWPHLGGMHEPVFLVVLALSFAVIAAVSVWALLTTGNWIVRGIVLSVVAVCAGAILALFGLATSTYWATATLSDALWLAVSLYVVRSCGYRLVRPPKARAAAEPRGMSDVRAVGE